MWYVPTPANSTITWNAHVSHYRWEPCGCSVKRSRAWGVLQSRAVFRVPPSRGRTSSQPIVACSTFTLCLRGSRIALFSSALALQILGPNEFATFVAIFVECSIIVLFVAMSAWVMRLFSRNDDVNDVDAPTEKNLPLTGSQHDIEQGSGN